MRILRILADPSRPRAGPTRPAAPRACRGCVATPPSFPPSYFFWRDQIRDRGLEPPEDWSPAIRRNVWRITNDIFADRSDDNRWCLERIAHYGGRLTTLEPRQQNNLRRDILRMSLTDRQRWLLSWLGNPRFCDPSVYDGLMRTPAMQAKRVGAWCLGSGGMREPTCGRDG